MLLFQSLIASGTRKYTFVSPDTQTILDAHNQELVTWLQGNERVFSPDWLSEYIVKRGIERVTNAQKLRAIIKKQNLDLLFVPKKYLYHIPGKPFELTDENYLVIAQKITGKSGAGLHLTIEQTNQLYCAALKTPYYDMVNHNYVVALDGRIAIIDTDKVAIPPCYEIWKRRLEWFIYGTGAFGRNNNPEMWFRIQAELSDTYNDFSKNNYDEQACTFVKKQMARRERNRKFCLGAVWVGVGLGISKIIMYHLHKRIPCFTA